MKLNYRVIGDGRPVILLHGLFGMSDNLQTFAKILAEKGYSLIIVDLRNHGHSPHEIIHTYTAMASDVADLINELSLVKPVVIGHSMGGKVAMQLAKDHPRITSALVVIDIAPYAYPVHHRQILDTLLSVDLTRIKTRAEAEAKLKEGIPDMGTRQFLLKNLYWQTPTQLAWRFNLHAINEQIEEVGKETWPLEISKLPILFIRGGKSGYLNPSRDEEILNQYTHASIETIADAGHWIHAEKPTELASVIDVFLRLN